jgi:hypothetical protein
VNETWNERLQAEGLVAATEDLASRQAGAAITGTVASDLKKTVRTLAVDTEWSVAHPLTRSEL